MTVREQLVAMRQYSRGVLDVKARLWRCTSGPQGWRDDYNAEACKVSTSPPWLEPG